MDAKRRPWSFRSAMAEFPSRAIGSTLSTEPYLSRLELSIADWRRMFASRW
jgi:hypothetical protein